VRDFMQATAVAFTLRHLPAYGEGGELDTTQPGHWMLLTAYRSPRMGDLTRLRGE
jgi:hypothetical protein